MKEELLEEFALENGADLVGFCELSYSPIKGQEELKYAVSIAVKLTDSVLKTIDDRPSITYFQQYRTVNALLDRIAFLTAKKIEKLGYNAFPVAASQSLPGEDGLKSVFSHKTAARLSGLGFIGKNAMLISKEYGSKIRLATVLTDMPLSAQREIIENGCGSCSVCVKICPAGAISGIEYEVGMKREDFFSAEKCSNNMKNYKDVGRGAVCGICIKNCPYNKLK